MATDNRMHHHLLIRELVAFGGLRERDDYTGPVADARLGKRRRMPE
jgi:hypothetical protein